MTGILEHIHITPKGREPMTSLAEARLIAGEGIEGDRYLLGTGTYSMKPEPGRQVTLIEAETLEAIARDHDIDLTPDEHRRNLTVRGVALNHFVGRQLRVGEVIIEGTRLNTPCKYIEMITKKAVYLPLLNRSGLCCIIVQGGMIRPGDRVVPVE